MSPTQTIYQPRSKRLMINIHPEVALSNYARKPNAQYASRKKSPMSI